MGTDPQLDQAVEALRVATTLQQQYMQDVRGLPNASMVSITLSKVPSTPRAVSWASASPSSDSRMCRLGQACCSTKRTTSSVRVPLVTSCTMWGLISSRMASTNASMSS